MGKIAIIGNPVSHSLSPVMHNAAFRYLNMEYEYEKVELELHQLKNFTDLARDKYAGFNVTVPYKTEVMKYLDFVSPEAEFAGSVNTVVVKNKKLYGCSTDGYGFEHAISESFKVRLKDESFFFIGCGGAAKAVIVHLLFSGVKKVAISNRTESKLEEFAGKLREKFPKVEILSCKLNSTQPLNDNCQLTTVLKEFPIIVHSTSLGLKKDDILPFYPEFLQKGMKVFDMIYRNTEFQEEAKKKGCITASGILMLLYQGVKSFEVWTGIKAPVAVMKQALFKNF